MGLIHENMDYQRIFRAARAFLEEDAPAYSPSFQEDLRDFNYLLQQFQKVDGPGFDEKDIEKFKQFLRETVFLRIPDGIIRVSVRMKVMSVVLFHFIYVSGLEELDAWQNWKRREDRQKHSYDKHLEQEKRTWNKW